MRSETILGFLGLTIAVGGWTALTTGCGGNADGGASGAGGTTVHGGVTSSGSGQTTGGGDTYACCLPSGNYACPDKAAFDQCIGFDLGGCLDACGLSDAMCQSGCFEQAAAAPHDPSACVANAAVHCDGSGSTTSGSGSTVSSTSTGTTSSTSSGGCSDLLSSCSYSIDCCSGNCTNGTCWGNDAGSPCTWSTDCASNNCTGGTCQ